MQSFIVLPLDSWPFTNMIGSVIRGWPLTHASVCSRHVHCLSHLSADDTYLWDGHVWSLQGKRMRRVIAEGSVPPSSWTPAVRVRFSCGPPGSSRFSATRYSTLLSTPWWPSASWSTQTPSRTTCSSWYETPRLSDRRTLGRLKLMRKHVCAFLTDPRAAG